MSGATVDIDELDRLLTETVRSIGLPPTWKVAGVTVSMSESFLLRELLVAKELSQQELADRLRLDKSRISRLASDLEERGWVVRERDPSNRRLYRVRLTRQGAQTGRRLEKAYRLGHAELFDAMTAKERAALVTGLTGLLRAMGEHPIKEF